VPTFADKGCYVLNVTDPHGHILDFLDLSHYFFFQVAPHVTHEAERTPFKTYYSENVVAPRIESRPLDLQPGTLTTRPQRRYGMKIKS
jgi:hypothetical protein